MQMLRCENCGSFIKTDSEWWEEQYHALEDQLENKIECLERELDLAQTAIYQQMWREALHREICRFRVWSLSWWSTLINYLRHP